MAMHVSKFAIVCIVFSSLVFTLIRQRPKLPHRAATSSATGGEVAFGKIEALRLLEEAAAENPTAGRSIGSAGALSDLVRPQKVSMEDWEESLRIAKDLPETEAAHVREWDAMTASPAAVNFLSYGTTYPFYMPPVELKRLIVVDLNLPLQPEQLDPELYPAGVGVDGESFTDGSTISPDEIGIFPVPGLLNAQYLEVWPKQENKCAPPGCPLVVFFLGGDEVADSDNLTEANLNNMNVFSQPIGRWAANQKQLEDLGVVLLVPVLSLPYLWSGKFELSDALVVPLVQKVLAQGKGQMRVDPNRIYTTGLSEGGFGAMQAAMRHPHIFSFALAFALGPNNAWFNSSRWQVSSSSRFADRKLKEVVIVQGALDKIGSYGRLDVFQTFLTEHPDVKITYRVWPKQKHYTWFRGYVGARNFVWLGCPLPWENRTGGPELHEECAGRISQSRKQRAAITLSILAVVAALSFLREYVRGPGRNRCSQCRTSRKQDDIVMPNTHIDIGETDAREGTSSKTGLDSSKTGSVEAWDGPQFLAKSGNEPLPEDDIMEIIRQQSCRTPFATAVETETGGLWTYRELQARISALVQRLNEEAPVAHNKGVAALRCGLLSQGGAEGILALLGILQAGRCLVPLDERFPDSRLSHIINDSQLTVAIVGALSRGREHAQQIGIGITIMVADLASSQWRPKSSHTSPTTKSPRLCGESYMNYTSGTTGKPKALVSMHRGLLSHALAAGKILRPRAQDVSLLHTPPLYGFHMCQMYPYLIVGAKIVLPLPAFLETPSRIWVGPASNAGVSFTAFVPSILDPQLGGAGLGIPKSLRLIKCSGEAFGGVTALRTLAIKPDLELVNWWGNTECLGCTAVRMEPSSARWISEGGKGLPDATGLCAPLSQALPVGLSVNWRTLHLLPASTSNTVQSQGIGEACVTGPAVCPPYLGRPKEAAKAFWDSRFGPGNLLRTGDILLNSNVSEALRPYSLRYVGRKDFQIKVNGVRMELGEIEEVVMQIEGVDRCVVKLHATHLGDQLVKQLVAFYVGRKVPAAEVQAYVGKQLPKAMIPHQVVHLTVFPRNDADKIDRNALIPPKLEEGVAMMDSLGFQRVIASKDDMWAHHGTQAMYSLVPFCLLYAHWCPFNLQDVTSETDANILDFLQFIHHIRILNVTALFMGISDRTSRKYYSPVKSFVMVAALYLGMGWPRIVPGAEGFSTLHRWTFLALLFYKAFIYFFDKLRLPLPRALVRLAPSQICSPPQGESTIVWCPVPPSLVAFIVLCITPIFGSVSLNVWAGHGATSIWCMRVSDAGRVTPGDQVLPWTETAFYGSPNGTLASWMLLFGYYYMGYHFGMPSLVKQRLMMTSLEQRGRIYVLGVRTIAALAAVGLAWFREVVDTPVLPPKDRLDQPMNTWDWPHFYDGFYALRVLADVAFAVLLSTAICQGAWAWNLVGRNLLFTFLGHMILAIDMPALLDCIAPAGAFLQMIVILLLPYVYSLSVGSFLFEIATMFAQFVRQRARVGLLVVSLICLAWFSFVLLGIFSRIWKFDPFGGCARYA